MKIIFQPMRRDERGYALVITIVFLTVSLVIFGSMMYWITSNAKVTIRNNQYNMSSEAAEAAVETAVARMDRDFLYQSLLSDNTYTTLGAPFTNLPNQSPPASYTFSDPTGATTNQISVVADVPETNMIPLNSQYAGLYGEAQGYTIRATATPTAQSGVTAISVPAIVSEHVQFANIPIFQFAIFYNIDLEICPGQPMGIVGPVFSNAGMWAGSENTTFSNTVTAVDSAVNTTKIDPFLPTYAPQGGNPTFLKAGQPTVRNDALVMPIGTNNDPASVRGIVEFPPAAYANNTAAAYSTNGEIYLMNAADLIISNSPSGTNSSTPTGTNLFVFFQDPSGAQYLTPVAPDYYMLKTGGSANYVSTNRLDRLYCSTNVQYAGYSFLTNVLFYDWREGLNSGKPKAVQAVQIDIGQFGIWATNTATNGGDCNVTGTYNTHCSTDKGHTMDSMYVYNAVNQTTTNLPAVRVVNGAKLPTSAGFTVVTPFPMYVWGDYNTHDSTGTATGANSPSSAYHAWPAALMADSITILSDGWSDGTVSLDPNSAADTTINAAMLEGITPSSSAMNGVTIPSSSIPPSNGSSTYTGYSGGVENFLRLLEDWGGQTLTYNGSIVVMFPDSYSTNYWSGNYYGVPARHWAFDQNFNHESGLPPLTPQTKAIIRGQWLAQ
jgi:Tfp pilus assembly protein PilX